MFVLCVYRIKGTVGGPWAMKVPPDAPGRDAVPRLLDGDRLTARESVPVETACKKLFSVKSSMYLRFAAPAGAAASGRRAMLTHGVNVVCPHSTMSADAGTLPAVTIRSCAAATGAASKETASLTTEIMTAPHALTEVFGDYLQSSRRWLFGESGQPTLNHNASVLRTHYSVK